MQSRHIKCVKFYECLIILNCNPYDIHKVNFLPSILIYDCRVLIRLATGHSRIKFHLKLTRAFSILIHSLGWLVWQIRMFLPMIKGAIQTHSLHRWWWSLSQRRSRKESKVRSSVAFLDLQKTLRGYRRQGERERERERVWVRKQCLQSWKRKDFELRKSALADDHKQSLFLSLCISLYLYISTSLYLSHSHSIYSTLPLFNSIFLSLPNSLSQSISLSHFYTLAHSLSLSLSPSFIFHYVTLCRHTHESEAFSSVFLCTWSSKHSSQLSAGKDSSQTQCWKEWMCQKRRFRKRDKRRNETDLTKN